MMPAPCARGLSLLERTTQPLRPYEEDILEYGGDDRDNPNIPAEKREQMIKEAAAARMEIVAALGGEAAVACIPEVTFALGHWNTEAYMRTLTEPNCLRRGVNMAQGEDGFGRKFVVLLLQDKADARRIIAEPIFQRRRETCLVEGQQLDGRGWVARHLGKTRPSDYVFGAKAIAPALKQVIEGTHPRYALLKV